MLRTIQKSSNNIFIRLNLILLLAVLLSVFIEAKGQGVNPNRFSCEEINKASDCENAIKITPVGKMYFICSPDGYGQKLEIANNSSTSIYFFEREHYTVWLKFKPYKDVLLSFTLSPRDSSYDFDFILFHDTVDNFCEAVASSQLKPIRSNISRNDPKEQSVTGLLPGDRQLFIHSGPGDIFSKAISVEKNETYYLVIDNVYGGNKGFFLDFDYYEIQKIKGVVKDENNGKPIQATIILEDISSGEQLDETQTNEKGEFAFETPIQNARNARYLITAKADHYFFNEKLITSADIDKDDASFEIKLPELKKGGKVQLSNINFYGDSPVPLPSAKPTLERLYQTVQTNPSLEIIIEGHTNGCDKGVDYSQKLSEERAAAVKNYLVEKGINEKRITTKGFNCQNMLYPNPQNGKEAMLNRRVEISVTKY